MTSYNIIKPISAGQFIAGLGADNLPYVQLAAGVIIGVLMQFYSRALGALPRRLALPAAQGGMVALLVLFWLLFRSAAAWVPAAFYVYNLALGILLISQFWTLANDIYDSRQARRLFGFIGGGASLGSAMGATITAFAVEEVGANNLLLLSAATLAFCAVIVMQVVKRQSVAGGVTTLADERGVGGGEALRLLRASRHLQVISAVIAFAAIGSTIIGQQLFMTAQSKGDANAVSSFLATVTIYLSLIGFVVQVGLTSRVHRSGGLLVALLLLPVSLGLTGVVILVSGALWAPALARVLDSSLRYTIDKTTREVLFLPLPTDLKYRAKPFVDVTVDRNAKAIGSLLVLVLIKPWGLHLNWQRLSYASLVMTGLWIAMALVARREYLRSFRRSIGAREVEPAALRMNVVDAATLEALVEQLADPDEASVLYAIEMLETLDKRHLISPLLLHHDSAPVRARALVALASSHASLASLVTQWTPAVNRMLKDDDAGVRAAAVRALVALRKEETAALLQGYIEDADPRVSVTAAAELADSDQPEDVRVAEAALTRLIADTRGAAAAGRREAAAAIAGIRNPGFRSLLVPLIGDPDVDVARQAIASARALGPADMLFVPAFVTLLGHRVLKHAARDALVSYGDDVVDVLAHFLTDENEHIWVRRHVPATLARLPTQASMDALFAALDDADGFLRYKIVEAIAALRRAHPDLAFAPAAVEKLVWKESARYYTYLTLRFNLVQQDAERSQSLLVRALNDKLERTLDRVYRLLGLVYPWEDIAAARYSIEHGDARARARGIEYLDTLLGGGVRKRVMPIIDEAPLEEKVRHANRVLRTRPRDLPDTLAQLIHEDDPVVAASAVDLAEQRRMWSLADDLEYVLAHRSTISPLVVEAAARAMASRRHEGGDRGLGTAALPVVKLADRLRAITLFDFVSVDELFRIAATGEQIRHEPGRHLFEEGMPANQVQFLLEGSVRIEGGRGAPTTVHAPAALAFEDMIEGRALRFTVTAVEAAVCLRLRASDFLAMLLENTVLAQGLFRMLLESPGAPLQDTVYAPRMSARVAATRSLPLEPVEKALRLRQNPLLGRATVEQLLALVAIAREVPLTAGRVLFSEQDRPAIFHVLDGEITLEADSTAPIVVGHGATIGVAETLAGVSPRGRATVTRDGRALRLDRDEFFGVLADHMDLLQGVFSGVLHAASREDDASGPPAGRDKSR
jgi:CRP-like cAMP-binding protein/HEAT repeat protein